PDDQRSFLESLMKSVNDPGKANQLRIEKFIEDAAILKQEAIEKANIVPASFKRPRSKRHSGWWEIYDLAHKLVAEARVLSELVVKEDGHRAIGWAIDVGRDAMLLQIRRAAIDRRSGGGKATGRQTTNEADKRKRYARQRVPDYEESTSTVRLDEGLASDVS